MSEKLMVLDITAAREGVFKKCIFDIVFSVSSENLDDVLAKNMYQAALLLVVSAGNIAVKSKKSIIREMITCSSFHSIHIIFLPPLIYTFYHSISKLLASISLHLSITSADITNAQEYSE